MRIVLVSVLLSLTISAYAQHKTDVLVFGASASGVAAAVQSARSGVKAILLNEENHLIGSGTPDMTSLAFDMGFWKDWQDSCKKDSAKRDPRLILENSIIKNTKGLVYLNNLKIVRIKPKGKGWTIEIQRNGKKEDIKCKVIIDAASEEKDYVTTRFKLVPVINGKIEGVISFDALEKNNIYERYKKTYRTSIAAGYGAIKDSLYYFPLGAFIAKQKPNLLVANGLSDISAITLRELDNIALWTNIGQAVGALAAYGPFFNTTADKANIRMIQNEVFTFKGFIYPVIDIETKDPAFIPVQKIIGSQILHHDFVSGKFNPDSTVSPSDIKQILSELHPRSRIWFMENPDISVLRVKDVISLISFIGGKEYFSINEELKGLWKDKFRLKTNYSEEQIISRKELAVLMDVYLSPFSVRVNSEGFFIK